jgi:DNA-binding MarR family transcriptional regulator
MSPRGGWRFLAPRAPLSAAEIAKHPRLIPCIRRQALSLLSIQELNPRLAAVFATQQRWLMAHMALAQYFAAAGEGGGLRQTKFIESVAARGVASKNTADAFLKEMLKYGYVRPAPHDGDRRQRPLEPSAHAVQSVSAWLTAHLATLDDLDGLDRREAFLAQPERIATVHPRIADGLLRSDAIRAPAPTFSLFTWLNEGGVVMDWLIAGLADVPPGVERVPSTVASFDDLGARIHLSRSHLTRKLRRAEAMGSLGWFGERGKSVMWVSAEFRGEYLAQQSVKLAIIDQAFRDAFAEERDGQGAESPQ